MQQKSKRIIVAILAAALVLALGAGLLFVSLPNGMQDSNIIAELSEDDFEYNYVSSLAYSSDTEQTSGENDVYGWGYKPDKDHADYAYITKINNEKLTALQNSGVTKLVINIPAEHGSVPVAYVAQDAFNNCTLSIVDINMPLSVHWQIKGNSRFTLDNNSSFARADGLTATFTEFKYASGSGITTLILPSNVWIDQDSDDKMEDNEPKYRYTEYLFKGDKNAPYTNLVVMPDVVNIFNGTAQDSDSNRPKMQGGLLSKSPTLQTVYFCTGRSEVLHLYPLTFENCTALREISLSAGVYLEDGARVFQGSSALEKFSIADEKTASAPLFYTVGADGALYTNNYSYSYYNQSSTERYYEWWKNGLTSIEGRDNFDSEWVPTKVWDSETNVSSLPLSEPENTDQKGTFQGDKSAISTTAKSYYATKDDYGKYDSGVGIPEGSYVFDVNGTDKNGVEDNDNDFETGEGAGQYDTTADFTSVTLTTAQNGNKGGTTASIPVDGGSITVTEKDGGNQSTVTVVINDVEYKSRMQFKQGSNRYLEIKVPFTFDITAYFAGSYTAAQAGTESYPQMALFSSSNFKTGDYKGYTGSKAKTAKTENAITKLADVTTTSLSGADHILKIENGQLKEGTYYIAQPADDPSGTSGSAQMLFLVITRSQTQTASSILVEQDVNLSTENPNWQRIPNDALIFQKIPDTYYFLDLQYPIVRYDKTCEIPFRVKALSSAGETLLSQDINWAIMDVNGQDVHDNLKMTSPATEADKDGYFKFTLKLEGLFSDRDFYGEGQHKQGKNFAIKFTAGDVTKYIFINLLPEAGNKDIPDANQWHEESPDPKPQHLNLVEENASRYQTLISMPAKAKSDDGVSYINSFDFSYHETVEIGPNAFQNTYITVIHIPDRIAKIGASAFRFSDHLQTVYLPDDADIGLNAFGQEADASPQDGTVYTAGKQNFFLIAPSRTSFEQYLEYAAIYTDDPGNKALDKPNYNVFPVHAEEDNEKGFQNWGGKDASYDYTPYLTYEIAVKFLTYDATGETLQSTETRTFLYGMDARYVKATATTEWAKFDEKYDNNAPVWFGRIKETESGKIVQQINTLSTGIAWSVAADGWYYDKNATLPAGDWYFGKLPCVTESSADDRMNEFTKFIGGWAGGHVNSNDIQSLIQVHYQDVMDNTYDAYGITETGQKEEDAGNLRQPVENYGYGGDHYYTTEFEAQTRWNRWWWNEKYDANGDGRDDGRTEQRFFTMPFSITLKSKEEERENRIDFDVPTFQNIGEITYGEDTINAAPKGAQNDTWNVPMLTVTFDYNGFPASRIFENFNSSAMKVEYTAWRRTYNNKDWRWYYPDNEEAAWSSSDWEAMRANINGDTVPYDAGYYKITLSFEGSGSGSYLYYWSGIYNGMRVDANANADTTFTFILNIQPRKVPLSHVYTMQYSGLGFSLFEDNPYIDVKSYGVWSGNADYTAEGLPCAVGHYPIKLKLHDPKYPTPGVEGVENSDHTPNLEWVGATGYEQNQIFSDNEVDNDRLNKWIDENGVELFILDGKTPVKWGSLYTEDENDEEIPITLSESLATFGSEVLTYTYTGAPISLEEVFGGVFSSSSIECTIERGGKSVTEIKNAGTYLVSITPAEGYVWWRGVPSNSDSKAGFCMEKWSLDEFWAEKGGYEDHKRDTLTFEVFVDKRIVTIPRDSYVPKEAEPPYEFEVPIGGDYEVMGYHEHDFSPEGTIPKAGETSAWSKIIFNQGVYDVLIRLTDPANTTWASTAGESHGDNYYIVARLYAGFDREKDYPAFKTDLGDTTGNHASDDWVELTHIYNGVEYGIGGGNDLFGEADARPTDKEATYTIYKFSEKPASLDEFLLLGEEVETVKDAGYYGIAVILNDPFYFKETEKMFAYYLVHIEKAKIEATFDLSNGGKATYDGSDRLKEFNDSTVSFATVYDTLKIGVDYNVIIADPANATEMIDAGKYTVKVELTSSAVASNYELTDGQTEYTIDPRPLTLDLGTITGHTYLDAPLERWYEKEDLAFDGRTEDAIVSRNGVPDKVPLSYQFKLGDDTFPLLSALSDAGDYIVEVLCGNPNYTVTLGSETHYKVAPLTLTLNDIESVTYDGEEHKPNISFTGAKMVLAEGEDYNLAYDIDAASGAKLGEDQGLPITAGKYTVTVTLLSTNYTFADSDSATATFTIEKATLAAPYLSTTTFLYTGNDIHSDVEKALSGNYKPDKMSVAFYKKNDGTGDPLPEVKEVGAYYLKVTLTDSNYQWEEETEPYLLFTVSQTSYDMANVKFESKSFEYDGKAHKLAIDGALPEGVQVIYKGSDGYDSDTGAVNAGTYTVTATFTGADQYESIAPMTATLTITAKTIVVEWEEKNYTYTGSELMKPNATAQGVGDDGVITLNVTLKTPTGVFQDADDYIFEAAFGSDFAKSKNYILVGTERKYTVAKATLTAPVLEGTFTYTGNNLKTEIEEAFHYDDTRMNVSFYADAETTGKTLDEIVNAGTYFAKFTLTDTKNYTWGQTADMVVTVTVAKRSVTPTLTATDVNATYGETGDALRPTVSGVPDGYEAVYVYTYEGTDYGPSTVAPVNVGQYTVTVKAVYAGGLNDEPFTVSAEAKLTINAREIGAKLDPESVTYNGQEQQCNISFTGLSENTTLAKDSDYTVTYMAVSGAQLGDSQLPLTAGSYTVTVTLVSTNYTFEGGQTATATFTINARKIEMTLNPANVSYNGTEQQPDVLFTGLPENVTLAKDSDYTVSYTAVSDAQLGNSQLPLTAGEYTVTVTLLSGNYTFEGSQTTTATFTIEKTTLAAPYLSSTSFPYTGEDLSASVRAVLINYTEGTMKIAFYDNNEGTGDALSEVKEAGDYFLKVTLTDLSYQWEEGQTDLYLPFTVARRTPTSFTLTATDVNATYGDTGAALQPTVSGVPAGYDVSYLYTYVGTDGTDYALSSVAPVNVGKYTVTVTAVYAGSVNDEPFTVSETATLTISAREIEMTLSGASVTYNGKEQKPNLSFTGLPENIMLLEGTDYTVSYKAEAGAQLGTAQLPLTAGSYTVTVTLLSTNYTFADSDSATATFTIEKATLAAPYLLYASFAYSGEDVREKVTAALRNYNSDTMTVTFYDNKEGMGDDLSEVTETGTYYVKVTLTDANYKWEEGTDPYLSFTVSQTAYDMSGVTFESKTFTYDGKEHSLSVQGLPEGVSVEYTLNEFVDVGIYTVTATFTIQDNATRYETPQPMTATLTITAKTIVVEWEEKNYTYTGSELMKPNATAQGVGDDGVITLNVTLKTPTGVFQDADDYIFEAAFGSDFAKSKNYILVGTERKYTVAKATLTAPVLEGTFTYTGNNLKTEIEEAFHYDDTRMNVSFYADAETTGKTLDEIVNAGTYFAKFTLTDTKNYTWGQTADMVVTVTVAKRSVTPTLTATDVNATYGETGDALRPTVSGVPDSYEAVYVYTYEGTDGTDYGPSTVAPVNVGQYTVTVKAVYAGGLNDEPFTVSAEAKLTINARKLEMTLSSETVTYNGQEQHPEILFTGLPENIMLLMGTDYTVSYTAETGAQLGDSKLPLTAGNYTVTVTLVSTNYTFEGGKTATATFTISARTIEMTLSSASVSYNGTEQQPDVLFTGLPENVTLAKDSDYTVTYTAVSDAKLGNSQLPLTAGEYTVTVTLLSGNYTFTDGESATATFTIEKAMLPAPYLLSTSFSYAGEDLSASVRAVLINYSEDTMNIAFYDNDEGTGNVLSEVKEAGTYYVKVTLNDANYAWKDGQEIYLGFTVLKRATTSVTITASDVELTYGEAMQYPTVTVSGDTEGYEVSYFYTYQGIEGTMYPSSPDAPVNVGTYEVTVTAVYAGGTNNEPFTATTTAKLTINAREIGAKLDPANFTYNGKEQKPNILFTGLPENIMLLEGTDYTVSYKAEAGAQLGTVQLPLTAGSYTVTVTLLSTNYTFADSDSATATFTIEKATLAAPYLSSTSFPYTGEDLSDGIRAVLINYSEGTMKIAFCKTNDGTGDALTEVKDAGDYFLKVTFTDLSYQWEGGEIEVYLPFTVAKKAVLKPSADDTPFVYTGAEQVYTVAENPAYTVRGNKQTNANEAGYKVTVTLNDKANYEWSGGGTDDVIFLFKIQKADYDMSGVRFSDQTVNFDGKEHSIFVEGDLPEGVSASYQGNGQISVGGYHVTVSFAGDAVNYNPIPSMHALLTIRYAEFDFSEITFENASAKYDGNAHSVYIQGELPEGVDVAYEGNEQREPGVYTVKAIFSDVRGVILEKTATLTVLRTHMEVVDPNGAVTIVVDSADGFDPTWELACDSVPDSIVRTAWAWEKDSFTANFTVKFVKDGVEVPFDGKLTVRLVIPQMLRDKEFTVQSMGRSASVEYTRDGDYVVFEADGLSAYEFTCESIPYLSILQIASGIALVSVAIMIALAIVIKKNKQGE